MVRMFLSSSVLGSPAREVNSISASSVRNRAFRDAHAVGVEEDHVPSIPVSERHQHLMFARLWDGGGELHDSGHLEVVDATAVGHRRYS